MIHPCCLLVEYGGVSCTRLLTGVTEAVYTGQGRRNSWQLFQQVHPQWHLPFVTHTATHLLQSTTSCHQAWLPGHHTFHLASQDLSSSLQGNHQRRNINLQCSMTDNWKSVFLHTLGPCPPWRCSMYHKSTLHSEGREEGCCKWWQSMSSPQTQVFEVPN